MANYIDTLIESVYNMDEVLSETTLELRKDFIPEKTYFRMIESIGKMITDGPFLLVSQS